MTDIVETITVSGDGITVPLLIWRRFRRPMPGLMEAVYARNHGLADLGPYLPMGTVVELPIPVPRENARADPIRLW